MNSFITPSLIISCQSWPIPSFPSSNSLEISRQTLFLNTFDFIVGHNYNFCTDKEKLKRWHEYTAADKATPEPSGPCRSGLFSGTSSNGHALQMKETLEEQVLVQNPFYKNNNTHTIQIPVRPKKYCL